MPLAAHGPQQVGVGRRPACTRTRGRPAPSGRSSIVGDGLHAEHLLALAGWCRRPRPRSRGRGCCGATTKPNLPGWVDAPATTTPRGSNRARNCSSVQRRRVRSTAPPPPARRRRPARRRPTISGLRSTRRRRVGRRPAADRPTSTSASALPVDGRLAAERPEQRLGGEVVDHLLGVDARRAAPGGTTTSADGLGEDRRRRRASRSCRTAGRGTSPAISSRLPGTIGATSSATVAVVGRGRGQQLGRRGRAPRRRRPRPQPHQAPLGLVGDARRRSA